MNTTIKVDMPDRLPPRTRAVLDFLQARVDLRHAAQLPPPWRA